MKKYQIIYADPPWDVKRGPEYNSNGPSKNLPYPTMSINEIKALPIKDISDKDSVLFLWGINKYIPEMYEVAKSWGFKPSCLLTWCKPKHGLGIGGTFVQTTEHLLLARRGTRSATKRVDTTWFEYKRGGHSVKPPEIREMIVELFGDIPRVELFAREKTEGWTSIGNDIDGRDIAESIKLLAQ